MVDDPDRIQRGVNELFENAPCGYLTTRPDGTIVEANPALERLAARDRASMCARLRFTELLTVPGRIYHDTHFAPLLRLQGFVTEVAFDLARPDGSTTSVLVNAVQKRDQAGQPLLNLITVFDATERRRYERELLLARRAADDAVAAERVARRQAEEATRVRDVFLASLSHELRTPLGAITGWTAILKRRGGLTAEQLNGISVIERNAHIQSQLINDLLDVSRIIAGKMRLDVQEVRLAEVIVAALDTVRPAAEAKSIRLPATLDPAAIVSGDPGRLQQVFWNLLSNAIKFSPKHGTVRVVVQRVNSHVEVSVHDNGQGMSEDFIAHAFERFRQSDARETQRSTGLGLGLSISKNLIEMHGGTITAASDGVGKGSTFRVELPLAVASGESFPAHRDCPRAIENAAPSEVRGLTLQGVQVLVVEDEPDSRDVLRRLLETAGASVETTSSVAEALAALRRSRPHVLISDIGLPGEDGYDLIRKVRMLGDGVGSIAAVALTALARVEDRTQALLAGYQMHLAKPVDARELIVTVASLALK